MDSQRNLSRAPFLLIEKTREKDTSPQITDITFRDGAFHITGSENLQTIFDRALPLIEYTVGMDALQPRDEGGTLAVEKTEEQRQTIARESIEKDLLDRDIHAIEVSGTSDSQETVTVQYVYSGNENNELGQLENAQKCVQYAVQAIADAREFFPFTDRVGFTILVLPVQEQHKNGDEFSYSPLFKHLYDVFKRRGLADSSESDILIICFPKPDSKEYFIRAFSQPPDEYQGIETNYDRSLYIQIRHEVVHGVQQQGAAGDSDFAGEGIAMLVESTHLNSNEVHAQVNKGDIDLDKIIEVANLRDYEGYSASEYMLYRVSQSLFRFIYDYFNNDANRFGEMLDLMRAPYIMSLSEAFQHVYHRDFKSILPMWEHELERSEILKRID